MSSSTLLSSLPDTLPESQWAWAGPALAAVALLLLCVAAWPAVRRLSAARRVAGMALCGLGLAAVHGFGLLSYRAYLLQRDRTELRAFNDALVRDAMQYLARLCGTERRLVVAETPMVLPAEQGVLLDIEPARRLALPDAPPLPSLPPRMQEVQQRHGEPDPQRMHERQYRLPVDWFEQVGAGELLAALPFAFVERDLRHSARGAITVTAPKLWWDMAGRASLLPPAVAAEVLDRLARADPLQQVEAPVRESTARYLLTGRDISTAEDRRHWVARAQLSLTDRRSGMLLAQYVGFAAHLAPAYEPGRRLAWQDSLLCPGPERAYKPRGERFDLVRFVARHAMHAAWHGIRRAGDVLQLLSRAVGGRAWSALRG